MVTAYKYYDGKFEDIVYQKLEKEYAGFGVGYRWQWLSGWNVTASVAVYAFEDIYLSPGQVEKESGIIPMPGINMGYKF